MKIDGINPQPLMDIINQSTGERGVVGYLLNIQTIKNNVFTGVVNAPVSVEEYEEYSTNLQALAEKKIIELYKLDVAEVDSFDIENYHRELEAKDKEIQTLKNSLLDLTLLISNGGK